MNTEKWQAMSNKDRYTYLASKPVETESQMFVRTDAVVGDEKPGDSGTAYRCSRGGVVLSDWHESLRVAEEQADQSLIAWSRLALDEFASGK